MPRSDGTAALRRRARLRQARSEPRDVRPGDILFTGSLSGSAGVHGDRWLRDGDRIHAEIEAAGVLENSVHDDRQEA